MDKVKGVVFFDYDGTLADEKVRLFHPTEKSQEAARLLQQNGYLVGLATGRAKFYVPETGINFDCIVSSNGACAEVNGIEIFDDFIEEENVMALASFLEKLKMGYILESKAACYSSKTGSEQFSFMIQAFNLDISNFYPLKQIQGLKINKLLVAYDDVKKYEKLIEEFGDKFLITAHRSSPSADVARKGMNKAVGIQKVLEHLGLNLKDTYAFGDGENDVDMFKAVGCGVAMEDHSPVLDDVAKMVTDSVSNEGIYNGLKRLKLI